MRVLALALFSVATALPLFKRQDSDVAVDMSDIKKFKEAQNSLPDSGTYRLDIVPGRKDGESMPYYRQVDYLAGIELVPDEDGSIIVQNNESNGLSSHGNGTAVVESHNGETEVHNDDNGDNERNKDDSK
ncbi:hypothetical protein E3Q06_00194 [Wallemia mellicola]|nr:hypothetical protein E3Q21_00657 [Wallemia mellicola]TIB91615.1 hypothetical protein E3Q20_00643 [Wallemia mellicola]TIC44151.1 hypothetical protein E3Q07_00194 [Wallemia mellicola]TIC53245.1 hypothetical protein E3Q06_00194 [Wallemia mellicola]